MKISKLIKIISGIFGAIVLGIIAAIYFSSTNFSQVVEYADLRVEYIDLGESLADASENLTTYAELYVLNGDNEYLDKYNNILEEKIRENIVNKLNDLGLTSEEKQLIDEALSLSNELAEIETKAFEARKVGNTREAQSQMFGNEYVLIKSEFGESIDNFIEDVNYRIELKADKSVKDAKISLISLFTSTILSIVVVFLCFYIINRKIKPINDLIDASNEIAKGNIDINVALNSTDEIGEVSHAFQRVIDTLGAILRDFESIAKEHIEGDYEYKIDKDKYSGAYYEIVLAMEETLKMYIDDFIELFDMMEAFGDGDFTADIRKYPGKWAVYNGTVEDFRDNLVNITNEINILAENANNGNLTTRVNMEGFNGDWGKIAESLNDLMENIAYPINESVDTLEEIAKGNFDLEIVTEYKGDFGLIKDSLNFTTKALREYIKEVSDILALVAKRDLTGEITSEFVGDFTEVKDSINSIIGELNILFGDILSAADQVNIGASQIADSSIRLAEGASEQATTIEQLNQSVSSIYDMTQKNSDNANEANLLSQNSMVDAQKGTQEMTVMLESINQIKESSNNIAGIVGVINDIAFQTNLLSLNASIEAASAGEHGKGFAVVAEEVRTLAGRSRQAVDEIQILIDDTLEKIEHGNKVAELTSQSLFKIVENFDHVSRLINDISIASDEQAQAVGSVTEGFRQISEVVQTNSATSEETAAASEELSSQAEVLNKELSSFKLR